MSEATQVANTTGVAPPSGARARRGQARPGEARRSQCDRMNGLNLEEYRHHDPNSHRNLSSKLSKLCLSVCICVCTSVYVSKSIDINRIL